jgi:hypothetical protein
MPWPKGKSRGSRCKVCKRYFQPNGLGPHMTSHKEKRERRFDNEKEPLIKLLRKAAALREEANQIEVAVRAILRLCKTYAT